MTEILPLLLCVQPALDATLTRQLAGIITALLTMTGRITMLGIARWGERGTSYRTVQRFFHGSVPWLQVGWHFFQQHLWAADDTYVLAGDETVVTKSGKTTHGVDRFFSSLVQKAVPSVAFFVLSLVSVKRRQSYPLLSQQVVRTADERAAAAARRKPKQKGSRKPGGGKRGRPRGSKKVAGVEAPLNAELLRVQGWVRLVVEVVRAVLGVKYLVLDGHFGNAGGYAVARGEGLELISKLRHDAALYEPYVGPQARCGAPRKYGAKLKYDALPPATFVSTSVADGVQTNTYQGAYWHKAFGRQLNVVVVVKTKVADGKRSHVVLFSSDLTLAAAPLVEYYRLRFQLEFNFREAKQHWGLEDFMVTDEVAVGNAASLSLFMVLVSNVLLGAEPEPGGERSLSDLQATYRGWRYVQETIKSLRLAADDIKMGTLGAAVSRLGRIHQECPAATSV
jgi:putative transposase